MARDTPAIIRPLNNARDQFTAFALLSYLMTIVYEVLFDGLVARTDDCRSLRIKTFAAKSLGLSKLGIGLQASGPETRNLQLIGQIIGATVSNIQVTTMAHVTKK